jgi:cell wall-associated NlpC family hydrolase
VGESLAQTPARLIAALFLLALLTACATRPRAQEADFPATPVTPEVTQSKGDEVVLHALSLMGAKYKFGGNSVEEGGFDCSGFVRHVYLTTAAIELPRSSREQAGRGRAVPAADLEPGDLVFYNTRRATYSHVGIYLGNGRFVHAPSRGKRVEIVDMNDTYWRTRFNGARRVLPPARERSATSSTTAQDDPIAAIIRSQ